MMFKYQLKQAFKNCGGLFDLILDIWLIWLVLRWRVCSAGLKASAATHFSTPNARDREGYVSAKSR